MTDPSQLSNMTIFNTALTGVVGVLIGLLIWFVHNKFNGFDSFKLWVEDKFNSFDNRLDTRLEGEELAHNRMLKKMCDVEDKTLKEIKKVSQNVDEIRSENKRFNNALEKGLEIFKDHDGRITSMENSKVVKIGKDTIIVKGKKTKP